MPRHISLLFPGQGSQSLNMLSTFSSSEINSVSNTVNNALEIDISIVLRMAQMKYLIRHQSLNRLY